MSTTRTPLPHDTGEILLTDAGLETVLIFEHGLDLPEFASFPLLETEAGRSTLRDYFRTYAALAERHGVGVQLETPTWRASADWGALLGFDAARLGEINAAAVALVAEVRDEFADRGTEVTVSGNIGPRGDGYQPGDQMSVDEAEHFHAAQVGALAGAGADVVTALTMTYVAEATGVARAAAVAEVPAIISFTVETDGRLPTGETLAEAVAAVDAATASSPLMYGVNCAHPDHFADALSSGEDWVERIGMVRANASRMSHEELDEATELDAGDAAELGQQFAALRAQLPSLRVLGGCCGTDHTHIGAIGQAVTDAA